MATWTSAAELARHGFGNATRAAQLVASWPDTRLMPHIAACADPDGVLATLARVQESVPHLFAALSGDRAWGRAAVAVAAASDVLARHIRDWPEHVVELRQVPASRQELVRRLGKVASGDGLRVAYRRALLSIVAADVTAPDPRGVFAATAERLADLADATVQAALNLAAREIKPQCRLGVIAMGKCGGRELNYVSDVDVIFVVAPGEGQDHAAAVAEATGWASAAMRICSAHTAAGTIWPMDANLRPEGAAGPLVRTLESMRRYYAEWAKPWEFQALLKARPMAGDHQLAAQFCDLVAERVWQVGDQPGFVADTQAMRRRVVSLIPVAQRGREIKLGEGGLRDVEFTVQLLQLIHGRTDDRVRQLRTLDALQALVDHGYVGRADGAELAAAYRTMRVLEHRIQLLKLRRTHVLPKNAPTLARLSKGLGFDAEQTWKQTSRDVLRLHRKIYYSPLLAAVASIKADDLVQDQAGLRLRSLGFMDAKSALRHVQALTHGLSRKAEIQRQLMPAMLGWFAESHNPDAALLAFRQVSEALGTSPWYLRALRDEGEMAQRLAQVLGRSRYVVGVIKREPQSVGLLASADQLAPRPAADLAVELAAVARRHPEPGKAVPAIRQIRRRELLRLSAGATLGERGVVEVGAALTDVMSTCLHAAWDVCARAMARRRGEGRAVRLAIVAMGRWGGAELGFGSDADAMFVLADEDADRLAEAGEAVALLRSLLSAPAGDPALLIDADLRPEGKSGALVRTVSSYREYYAAWSRPWEAQALLRASFGAGDHAVWQEFAAIIAPLRWPVGGPSAAGLAEMRRLKARMEAERLPRGANPATHTKLGPGGLSDVEWTVQLMQLCHAHDHHELRVTGTLGALEVAESIVCDASECEPGAAQPTPDTSAVQFGPYHDRKVTQPSSISTNQSAPGSISMGAALPHSDSRMYSAQPTPTANYDHQPCSALLSSADATALRDAWLLASQARNATLLVRGKTSDSLPTDPRELSGVAQLLGYGRSEGTIFLDDYRKTMRRCRSVVERLFYDGHEKGASYVGTDPGFLLGSVDSS